MDKNPERKYFYFSQEDLGTGAALLLEEINEGVHILGFDSEFTQKDSVQHLSLIQLATSKHAYLFHVHGISSLPDGLLRILKNDKVAKIGFGLQQDYIVLYSTFKVQITCLDLQVLLYASHVGKTFSLKEAVETYCGYKLSKNHTGVHWQWGGELDESKKKYAADDSFACIDLWEVLKPKNGNSLVTTPPRECQTKDMKTSLTEEQVNREVEKAFKWLATFEPTSSQEATYNKLFVSYGPWQGFSEKDKKYISRVTAERHFDAYLGRKKSDKDSPRNTSDIDIEVIKKFLPGFWTGEARQKEKVINHIANSCNNLSFFSMSMIDKRKEVEKLIGIMIEKNLLKFDRGFLSYTSF